MPQIYSGRLVDSDSDSLDDLVADDSILFNDSDNSSDSSDSVNNGNGHSELSTADTAAALITSQVDLSHIHKFLGAATPAAWIKAAKADMPTIMQDHANCEKKAAGTAMNLIFRYEFAYDLQCKLAQLIREEMLHYEQVIKLMHERGLSWTHLPAGRYAKGMLKHKRTHEPEAMIDTLIIGAFIEARSCERFAALAAAIDDEKLAKYYRYLLKSESRHFEDYLALAQSLSEACIDERVALFCEVEAELITSPDSQLRFHSGVPA